MTRHPGGPEQTGRLLDEVLLRPGARVVDLGAGDGESVRLLRSRGFDAVGVDKHAAPDVEAGDLLRTRFEDGAFDAVEFSRTADETAWLPKAEGYAVTRSSDAHNLDDVARVWTEADLPAFNVAALKAAFAARATTLSPRLTTF